MLPSKERLVEITSELVKLMRIRDWDITIVYTNEFEVKHIMGSDNLDTAMLCQRYRLRKEADIFVNENHTALDKDWYECIVHELFHIVTGEISDIAEDLMDELSSSEIVKRHETETKEVMVVQLAKIFVSLYPETNFIKEDKS